jgi:uncharacterized protein YqgC (DUF456 family)
VDITDTNTALTVVCAVAIIVGIFGTFIPFVPGLFLSWAAVGIWALFHDGGRAKWIAFGIVTVLAVLGSLLKFVLPGRKMHREGVPKFSLFVGAVAGIIGFFVIPVIGLFICFVLGVFLAELVRLQSAADAWPSTWKGVKAVFLSAVIEIVAGLLIMTVFIWTVVIV